MKKLMKQQRRAFTLIEMAVVLFIISLLILIILPNLSKQRHHASAVHGDAMVNVVQTQVDLYENEHNSVLPTFAVLERDKYLSSKQVKQARQEGIVIDGTEVHHK